MLEWATKIILDSNDKLSVKKTLKTCIISNSKKALKNTVELRIKLLLKIVSTMVSDFFLILFWLWIIGRTIKISGF